MFVVTVSTEQRFLVNRAASRNMLSLLLTLRPKPVSPLLKPQLVIFIPSYPSTIATNWSKVIESESISSSFPRSLSSRLKAHDLVQVAVLRQRHHPGHRVRKLLIQLLVQAEQLVHSDDLRVPLQDFSDFQRLQRLSKTFKDFQGFQGLSRTLNHFQGL